MYATYTAQTRLNQSGLKFQSIHNELCVEEWYEKFDTIETYPIITLTHDKLNCIELILEDLYGFLLYHLRQHLIPLDFVI
ncbi:hypothetical protein CDFC105_61680 [Clostridioides difficile]|nr:hypothetical protein CDFC105_61680 [Clostridioides difficile]